MAFSKDFIRRVSEATDILGLISSRGINLKKAGASFKGLCPFHSEKTPSFNVNPQRGFFHCFGCGASGDSIKFLIMHDRLSFAEAVEELAKMNGLQIEHDASSPMQADKGEDLGLKCLLDAELFYHQQLMEGRNRSVLDYLNERMIPEDQWSHFKLGYAPDGWTKTEEYLKGKGHPPPLLTRTGLSKTNEENGRRYDRFRNRLLFPVHDVRGRCIGFGGRVIHEGDLPKYLNGPETPYYRKSLVLYGLYQGMEEIRKSREIICVEGYLDVIRLHEYGFKNAVAPCGTALTEQHLQLVKRYAERVILLFDGDDAGREAARIHGRLFLPHQLEASVVMLPDGSDPDSFLLDHGADAFRELQLKQMPVLDYLLQQTLSKYPDSLQGKLKALDELLPIFAEIKDQTLKQMTLNAVAEKMGLPTSQLLEKSRKFLKNPDQTAIQSSPSVFHEESRDELWILQTLLKNQDEASQVRSHLQPEELQSPRLKKLYEALLEMEEQGLGFSISTLEEKNPELYQAAMSLSVEELPQHDVLLSIKRIKQRNLKSEFQELGSQGSMEERLRARLEHRKKQKELVDLLGNPSLT